MTSASDIFEQSQPPLTPPRTAPGDQAPAEPTPNGGRKPRKKAAKKRGRRAVVASPAVGGQAAPAVEPAKRPRKVRAARKPRAPKSAERRMKLDLTTMMGALVGLKPDDAHLVGKITQALQTVNKKSRARVLEAVGRIFS